MAYKGNWATGDLIDTTAFQELVNSAVYSFASLSALTSAISSPVDGQIAFAQDTEIYHRYDADSTSWVNLLSVGDITGVTITTASGSGLSGGATATSGDFSATLTIDINGQSSVTATVSDEMLIADVTDSNAIKKITLNDLPISSATQTALDNITAGTSTLTIPLTVTVADDGSGSQNVFYIAGGSDSSGTKSPSLDLAVGFKYKFDVSDASNSGHPLKFSITEDGTHNSGSTFTTNVTESGTAGTTNAFVQLEVTPETMGASTSEGAGTPTLYYFCSNHSGMGGLGKLSLFASGGGSGTQFDQFLLIGA
nr:hypothetical protein [uncultured Mediterranean phage uvMED]